MQEDEEHQQQDQRGAAVTTTPPPTNGGADDTHSSINLDSTPITSDRQLADDRVGETSSNKTGSQTNLSQVASQENLEFFGGGGGGGAGAVDEERLGACGSPHVPNKNRRGGAAAATGNPNNTTPGGQRTPISNETGQAASLGGYTGSQVNFGAFDESYVATGPSKFKQPKRVSSYILGPILGEGAFGVVRDAIDVARGQRVAIKVIRKKFRKESELKRIHKHLVNEVEYLQRFHHAGIIRAVDIFCSPQGKDYIVLPAAVASLQQLIEIREKAIVNAIRDATSRDDVSCTSLGGGGGVDRSGSRVGSYVLPTSASQRNMSVASGDTTWDCFSFGGGHGEGPMFPVTFVRDTMSSLLSGVAYMHQQGVAHNDINPNNILLFRDGTVKLTDLGSCGPQYQGNGTPAFASPEIAAGEVPAEQVDAKAYDVWCCGVVLYYLLTHRMPTSMIGISTEFQLYEAIAKKEVDFSFITDAVAQQQSQQLGGATSTSAFSNVPPHHHSVASGGTVNTQTPVSPSSPDDLHNARKLVERMLTKDPRQRVTAQDALENSWLQCAHTGKVTESPNAASASINDEVANYNTAGDGKGKKLKGETASGKKKQADASTPLTSAAGGGANEKRTRTLSQLPAKIRRIFNVKDIAHVVNKDNVRHYYFVDDIATLMGIKVPDTKRCLPKRIPAPAGGGGIGGGGSAGFNTYNNNTSFGSSGSGSRFASQQRLSMPPSGPSHSSPLALAQSMPPMPAVDPDHFVRKGKPMFDVRTFNGDPKKKEIMQNYTRKVLSGYVLVGTAEENLGVNQYPEALPDEGDATKQASCPCTIS